jgi:hypothetical protein
VSPPARTSTPVRQVHRNARIWRPTRQQSATVTGIDATHGQVVLHLGDETVVANSKARVLVAKDPAEADQWNATTRKDR